MWLVVVRTNAVRVFVVLCVVRSWLQVQRMCRMVHHSRCTGCDPQHAGAAARLPRGRRCLPISQRPIPHSAPHPPLIPPPPPSPPHSFHELPRSFPLPHPRSVTWPDGCTHQGPCPRSAQRHPPPRPARSRAPHRPAPPPPQRKQKLRKRGTRARERGTRLWPGAGEEHPAACVPSCTGPENSSGRSGRCLCAMVIVLPWWVTAFSYRLYASACWGCGWICRLQWLASCATNTYKHVQPAAERFILHTSAAEHRCHVSAAAPRI